MTFQPTGGLGGWTLLDFITFDLVAGFSGAAEGAASDTSNYVTTPSPPFSSVSNCLCFQQTIGGKTWSSQTHNTGQKNYLFAGWVYFSNNFDPPNENAPFDLVALNDSVAGQICRLELQNDNGIVKLKLYDSNNNEVANKDNPDFSADTWHFLTMYIDTTTGDGTAKVRIDGILQLTTAVRDFDPGAYTRVRFNLEGQGGAGFIANPTTVYWSTCLFGSTTEKSEIDLTNLGEFTTMRYRIGNTGITPDYNNSSGGSGAGDDLEVGNWEDASDGVSSDDCLYDSSHGGTVLLDDTDNYGEPGPIGSASTNNDIIAAKWLWNYSGEAVAGNRIVFTWGIKDSDGNVGQSSTRLNATASDQYYQRQIKRGSSSTRRVPFFDETLISGFKNEPQFGAADTYLREAWCWLLVKTPVTTLKTKQTKILGKTTVLGKTTIK